MVSADGTGVAQAPPEEPGAAKSDSSTPSSSEQQSPVERPMTRKEMRKERKRLLKEERKRAKIAKAVLPFQSDAVELEYRKVAGGARWTLYVAILLMCSAVGWAYWAEVDIIVVSQGELVPVDPPVVIQPAVSAPVKSIRVRQFDRVVKGQVLVELDPTYSDSDVEQLSSDIRKAKAKIERLKAELDDKPFVIAPDLPKEDVADYQREYSNFLIRETAHNARLAEFLSTIEKLKIKHDEDERLEAQYTAMKEDYVAREQREVELVKRSSINRIQLEETRIQLKRYHTEVIRIQGQQRQTTAELATARRSMDSFVAEWKATAIAEQIEAQKELDKSRQALDKARYNQQKSTISVPTNLDHEEFYVIEIAERTIGSMVQAGEPVMRLMPIDAKLEAEVEIQGKDIGQLHTQSDLPVRVKLTSFEYQKYGFLNGKIRTISEGTVQKSAGEGKPALSVYKARVTLDFGNSPRFKKPKKFKQLPGMTVITDINVGKRRVIDYFLYPFFKHLDSSIREP
ncbi:MAG: HlyD family type I secretion periplasmic adaptor subunit [Planctomycetota bacterium]|nr:HlyD family type I secretion periplasmic adaptor subunit [Planctomycetota bacterium]